MAKKITDTQTPAIETHDVKQEQVPTVERKTETKAEESEPASEPKVEKKPKEEVVTTEVPDDRILKTYTNYSSLYIDFHGGTFTVDTPPAFRSDATLYQNPYYKKP